MAPGATRAPSFTPFTPFPSFRTDKSRGSVRHEIPVVSNPPIRRHRLTNKYFAAR
jgi:hypothetical protein